MSSTIPKGWKEFSLKDTADNSDRYSFTGGPFGSNLKSEDYTETGVRIIQLQNIGDGQFLNNYKIYTSEKKADELMSCNIFPGNIILSKMGDPVARATIIPNFNKRYLMASDGIRLSLNNRFDTKFVLESINSNPFRDQANTISTGTTRKRIGLTDLRELTFIAPPLPEQQKIATVLTAVDEWIESTQALISKYKDLKTAMMQELLSKGIGHTEFKDSSVGLIPTSWECCLVDRVARRGSGHTPDKQKSEYWDGGIKWISLADSSKLDRLYISETENEISELGVKNSSAVVHPKGTVVLSRDAGIGKSAITTESMAVSQHFMAWICSDKLNNYFLYYLLQLWKPRFENIAMGSTIKTIGLQYFKSLEIPVPPLAEQEVISKTLLSVEELVFAQNKQLASLVNLKKALMQDLLTGKVRVPLN